MPEATEHPELPAWLNPDFITPEMWAIREKALAVSSEINNFISTLAPHLVEYRAWFDLVSGHGLGDDLVEVVEDAIGTGELFTAFFRLRDLGEMMDQSPEQVAQLADELSTAVDTPTNERQARPLREVTG